MSAETQKRMEDMATTLVRVILFEHFPSTVEEMEKAAAIIGTRWANHTLAAIGAERVASVERINELEAALTTIRDTLPLQNDAYARMVFRVAANALEPYTHG